MSNPQPSNISKETWEAVDFVRRAALRWFAALEGSEALSASHISQMRGALNALYASPHTPEVMELQNLCASLLYLDAGSLKKHPELLNALIDRLVQINGEIWRLYGLRFRQRRANETGASLQAG